jgi:outer membrane protein TolC
MIKTIKIIISGYKKVAFFLQILIMVAAMSLAIVNPNNAQSLIVSEDSLLYYKEVAVKNNPAVLQSFYEYRAALQKIPQVGALTDPEINFGIFLQPMELVEGKEVADIKLMQMFPWFGVLKNARDEMSLMAKAKYELFHDAKLQVYYDVQRTWYELYKKRQEINISEKNIQLLQTMERLALVKFRTASYGNKEASSSSMSPETTGQSEGSAGMQTTGGTSGKISNQPSSFIQSNNMGSSSGVSGLSDLYRIQIEAGDLENSIALLKNQYNTTLAMFNSYLNRPVETSVAVIDTLRPDSLKVSLVAVSDSMRLNNPMLGMLQFEQQSLDARKRMIIRMGYPMIGVGVNLLLINKSDMSISPMNGKDMIMPMVTVTLPIYRKKYKAMRSEAVLMETVNIQKYNSTSNSLQTEYYQAVQLFQDSQRRMKLYNNQYSLANKTLDIMLKSFSTSGNALTDILRIRQQTLDYEFKQVEAVVDFNTSVAWLERLMANNVCP